MHYVKLYTVVLCGKRQAEPMWCNEAVVRARVENDGFAIIDGIVPPNELSILLQKLNEALLRRSRAGVSHLMSNNDVELRKQEQEFHISLPRLPGNYGTVGAAEISKNIARFGFRRP